jgi:hypothetical protein
MHLLSDIRMSTATEVRNLPRNHTKICYINPEKYSISCLFGDHLLLLEMHQFGHFLPHFLPQKEDVIELEESDSILASLLVEAKRVKKNHFKLT